MKAIKIIFACLFALVTISCATSPEQDASNPIVWADVPDVSVIRVGDDYYMSSTTMHMSPGLPIMTSRDLVNWRLLGYAYDTLENNEALTLANNKNAYGQGSWASSLRFHNGYFYVSTFSASTGKTHVYKTQDIHRGQWEETSFEPSLHDHSLFFENGRVYLVYGSGDIQLVELEPDLTGIKKDGVNKTIITNASRIAGDDILLPAEGSQLHYINGKYYLLTITWPRNGMRTVLVHRADSLTGPYEGRVALQYKGIAQGGLIDTPDGKWYAMLFGDRGAVGRIPYLVPVTWEDGWPVLGVEKNGERVVPDELTIPVHHRGVEGIVTSDDFDNTALPLAWQWNHNPDNRYWSLTERKGFLRLTTSHLSENLLTARNTLTQRTFGPQSTAEIRMDVSAMRDGDVAGLGLLQKHYGYLAIKQQAGKRLLVSVNAETDAPEETVIANIEQSVIYLRAHGDFDNQKDQAQFSYSVDGKHWELVGKPLHMKYTLPHFMGYRFALFNFATKQTGGYVDMDYFRLH
jgi:beta-xylosidase